MRSLAFKETTVWTTKRGSRLKQRNLNVSLFLSSGGVKENRKILLCKKSGGNSRIVDDTTKRGIGPRFLSRHSKTARRFSATSVANRVRCSPSRIRRITSYDCDRRLASGRIRICVARRL